MDSTRDSRSGPRDAPAAAIGKTGGISVS